MIHECHQKAEVDIASGVLKQEIPPQMRTGERLLSLDVFRGATMAAMILVNNPGTWAHMYPLVSHATWGETPTPTDLIFPNFLLIMGMAIPLALAPRLAGGASGGLSGGLSGGPATRALVPRILRRGAVIFGLGVLLYLFPRFDFATMRIPGVLQRIAVVYVACALIYLHTSWRTQIGVMVGILIGYWLLMTLVSVPGYTGLIMTPQDNLAAWLDRRLLGGHIWTTHYDPEGILSSLPAVATGLIGVLAGRWLQADRDPVRRTRGLVVAGGCLTLAGLVWSLFFPLIKDIWSSSYVLYCAGIGLLIYAGCYWLVDVRRSRWWTTPFAAYGVNCLAVYVAAHLGTKLMIYVIKVPVGDGQSVPAHRWIYDNLLASWLAPEAASLAFSVAVVLFWLMPLLIMYQRRIVIKI